MPVEDKNGQFLCEQCTSRYNECGDCPKCEDEPLMDLADDEVRHMISSFDDTRWRKRAGQMGLVSIAVMFPVAVAAIWATGSALDDRALTREILFVSTIMAVALSGILTKRFAPPRRLRELTPEEIEAFGD